VSLHDQAAGATHVVAQVVVGTAKMRWRSRAIDWDQQVVGGYD
jgi:hypothetical protein